MTMDTNQQKLDPLQSPMWAYLNFAAESKFTTKEKQEIMKAQLEREKEYLESSKMQ